MDNQDYTQIFPAAEPASAEYFTGNVKISTLLFADEHLQCSIYNLVFEKEARTNWHTHAGGQIVLITYGEGLYQNKGEAVKTMKKGDVITFLPHVEHWHGASADSSMTHIAINPNTEKGLTTWLGRVSNEAFFA